jgi:hypothetical protein
LWPSTALAFSLANIFTGQARLRTGWLYKRYLSQTHLSKPFTKTLTLPHPFYPYFQHLLNFEMMRHTLLLLVTFTAISSFAQRHKVMLSDEDPYHMYVFDGDSTNLYYYEMVPENPIKGVLVLLAGAGQSTEWVMNQITMDERAAEEGLLVIMPSYNMGTIQRIPDAEFLDTVFQDVVNRHEVNPDEFVLYGLSNGGLMALTYAVQAVRDSNRFLTPRAVVGIDPPIDLARLYRYSVREIERNFSEGGVAEAKWIKSVYEQVYGGSPDEYPQAYQAASVYSPGAEAGGNTRYLTEIPIRMHSDLNLDFMINEHHRDLSDWNGTDAVAFVNQLRINGNEDAQVVITRNVGRRPDGTEHPHSWNIADTEETLDWILDQLD